MLTLEECAQFLDLNPEWAPVFISERRDDEVVHRVLGLQNKDGQFFNLRTIALSMRIGSAAERPRNPGHQ